MNRTVITVMAYEDLAAAKLAKEKWDLMVGTLRHNHDVELRLWNFEALGFPELSNVAVKDAAQAEVIMVATNGAADFSPVVRGWIEQWLVRGGRRHRPRACSFSCAIRLRSSPGLSRFHNLPTSNGPPGKPRWIFWLQPHLRRRGRA